MNFKIVSISNMYLRKQPNNYGSTWPDYVVKDISNSDYGDLLPVFIFTSILGGLNKSARILDIGAGVSNNFVRNLHKAGYDNSIGIDVDPQIKKVPFSECMNIRDIHVDEKFDVIYFKFLLDFFSGGTFSDMTKTPVPLELLAEKIDIHLKPGGKLMIVDVTNNFSDFISLIEQRGYIEFKKDNVWVKPEQ